MSTSSRVVWVALTLTLVACAAAPKSGNNAPEPTPPPTQAPVGGQPASAAAPGAGKGDVAKASVDKPSEGSAAKPTSPTSDTGPSDPSATTPSKRLEDVQMNKNTGGGGSYTVSVRSAAGLVPDEVGKAVNGAAGKTDGCYAKVFKKPGAAGSTSFEVSVGAKGTTSGVKMVSDSLKDAETAKCLEGALKAIAWPKPTEKAGGKTTIDFTVAPAPK